MYFALIGLLFLTDALEVPQVGQRVVVELKNGYRVEGVLVEKDPRALVLALGQGEVRFDLKRVRRFHSPESATRAGSQPAEPRTKLSVAIAAEGVNQQLVFSIPTSWKNVENATGRRVYSSARGESRFQVEESAEVQSLWRITAKIRRTFGTTHSGFRVKQERFGNRWQNICTWEIDFEYVEGEHRYRERHLVLDFGATKHIFSCRTRAERFANLIGHFDGITSGLAVETSGPELLDTEIPASTLEDLQKLLNEERDE